MLFFRKIFIPILSIIAFSTEISAQEMLESDYAETKDLIFGVTVENDFLGDSDSDKHYTSGVRFNLLDVNANDTLVAEYLSHLLPIHKQTRILYSFGQNMYTPTDIASPVQDVNDRPWAGHLYGSFNIYTKNDNHYDEFELSFGMIGPAALGEPIQKFVHKVRNITTPEGWDNQLENEPTLGLGWVKRYNYAINAHHADNFSFWLDPFYGATVGNAHTFANAGFNIQISPRKDWQDIPVRVRPGFSGSNLFEEPENKFSWSLFGGIEGRAVARNIFLDGNTFKDSHSVDKKHFVMDTTAGISLTYSNVRLSYTLVHRTKEFEGQKDPSLFGAINVDIQF